MAEKMTPFEYEMIDEARRTTHAVRSLARFVILQVTYSVLSAIALVIGALIFVNSSPYSGEDRGLGVMFIVIGGLLAVIGLLHSITAAFSELAKSNRDESAL